MNIHLYDPDGALPAQGNLKQQSAPPVGGYVLGRLQSACLGVVERLEAWAASLNLPVTDICDASVLAAEQAFRNLMDDYGYPYVIRALFSRDAEFHDPFMAEFQAFAQEQLLINTGATADPSETDVTGNTDSSFRLVQAE